MTVLSVLDAAGRRGSPATLPGYHAGRPPRNKGMVAVGSSARWDLRGGRAEPSTAKARYCTGLLAWVLKGSRGISASLGRPSRPDREANRLTCRALALLPAGETDSRCPRTRDRG